MATRYGFRGKLKTPTVQFLGPFGRLKAKIWRGRMTPEVFMGFQALERPGLEQRLRGEWGLLIDSESRKRLMLQHGVYHVEFRFAAPIPVHLEQALRDIFTRRRAVGSWDEERKERGRKMRVEGEQVIADRIAAGEPDHRTASPSEYVAWYRKLRAENPEAWEALKRGERPNRRKTAAQQAKE